MKVCRTVILTMLLYASVVSHPGNAGKSSGPPTSTAVPVTSSATSTSAAPASSTRAPSSASNSTPTGKAPKTTEIDPISDASMEAVNAVVNMLTQYVERISEAIQTNLPGLVDSKALTKYSKEPVESPWDFLRGLRAFQGALDKLGITPPKNKTTVGGKKVSPWF